MANCFMASSRSWLSKALSNKSLLSAMWESAADSINFSSKRYESKLRGNDHISLGFKHVSISNTASRTGWLSKVYLWVTWHALRALANSLLTRTKDRRLTSLHVFSGSVPNLCHAKMAASCHPCCCKKGQKDTESRSLLKSPVIAAGPLNFVARSTPVSAASTKLLHHCLKSCWQWVVHRLCRCRPESPAQYEPMHQQIWRLCRLLQATSQGRVSQGNWKESQSQQLYLWGCLHWMNAFQRVSWTGNIYHSYGTLLWKSSWLHGYDWFHILSKYLCDI